MFPCDVSEMEHMDVYEHDFSVVLLVVFSPLGWWELKFQISVIRKKTATVECLWHVCICVCASKKRGWEPEGQIICVTVLKRRKGTCLVSRQNSSEEKNRVEGNRREERKETYDRKPRGRNVHGERKEENVK